jgi:cobalt/nickel transport system permease protein
MTRFLNEKTMLWLVCAWIIVVAFTPITALKVLAVEFILLCFLLGIAGVNPEKIWRKWRSLLLTLLFLSVFVALGHPLRPRLGMIALLQAIILKNALLLATIAGLSERLGSMGLLTQLGRLGLPRELMTTISLMTRYGPLLADQVSRMQRARDSRMIRKSLPGMWLIQTGGLSVLLVRSLERAERLNDAMLARGWQSGYEAIQSSLSKSPDKSVGPLDRTS